MVEFKCASNIVQWATFRNLPYHIYGTPKQQTLMNVLVLFKYNNCTCLYLVPNESLHDFCIAKLYFPILVLAQFFPEWSIGWHPFPFVQQVCSHCLLSCQQRDLPDIGFANLNQNAHFESVHVKHRAQCHTLHYDGWNMRKGIKLYFFSL